MKFTAIEIVLASGWYVMAMLTNPPMTARERVLYCCVIALVGGMLAASRGSRKAVTIVRTGFETAVLGVCLALMADRWVRDDTSLSYAIIAASGLLGMGGKASVDWVLEWGRKIITKKANSYVDNDKK
jgi:hypothetical protein